MGIADIMNSIPDTPDDPPDAGGEPDPKSSESEAGESRGIESSATDSDDDDGPEGSSSGEAPEPDEKYEVTVQGEKIKVSLEDLKSGYMQQADYTRKSQELAKGRKELARTQRQMEESQSAIRDFFGDLSDPSKVISTLSSLGPDVKKSVNAALEKKTIEILEEWALDETEQAKRAHARQQQELEEERRRFEEERKSHSQREQIEVWERRIASWTPEVLSASGLPDNQRVRRLFAAELQEVLESGRAATKEDFSEAAQALASELPELVAKGDKPVEDRKTRAHPPSAPRRGGGGPRKGESEPKKKERSADFFRELRKRGF